MLAWFDCFWTSVASEFPSQDVIPVQFLLSVFFSLHILCIWKRGTTMCSTKLSWYLKYSCYSLRKVCGQPGNRNPRCPVCQKSIWPTWESKPEMPCLLEKYVANLGIETRDTLFARKVCGQTGNRKPEMPCLLEKYVANLGFETRDALFARKVCGQPGIRNPRCPVSQKSIWPTWDSKPEMPCQLEKYVANVEITIRVALSARKVCGQTGNRNPRCPVCKSDALQNVLICPDNSHIL